MPLQLALQGKREFAAVMLRRLKKLGINKTDPSELTPEEVGHMHLVLSRRDGMCVEGRSKGQQGWPL